MFHLGAFSTSIAQNSFLALSLAADGHLTPNSAGAALMNYDCWLTGAIALGATINRAQISAPSQRRVSNNEIIPVEISATPTDVPALHRFPFGHGPHYLKTEAVQPFAQQGSAGAEQETVFIWLDERFEPAPEGETYPFRFTAAITGVNFTWVSGAMTPVDVFPAGLFSVVGMWCSGANLGAARLLPPYAGPRPGVLGMTTLGNWPHDYYRYGRAGKFLDIESPILPLLEIFGLGAITAQVVVLDIVKIR